MTKTNEYPFGVAPFIFERINRVLEKYPAVKKAVIFGSRAIGNYRPHSDIDIGIYAEEMSDRDFSMLRFEIMELPIVFPLDVVHVERLTNQALKKKVDSEGQIFYKASTI